MTRGEADRILELARELGALVFGDFLLSSGQRSSYYFDGRLLTLNPEGSYLVSRALLPVVYQYGACLLSFKNWPKCMQTINIIREPTIRSVSWAINQAAQDLQLSSKFMPSGAGHDAQEMAVICPIGMIFIPSKDGISHSPREYSSQIDITNGANVLLHTILKLDEQLREEN